MKIKVSRRYCRLVKSILLLSFCSLAGHMNCVVWGLFVSNHLRRVKYIPTGPRLIKWVIFRLIGITLSALLLQLLNLQSIFTVTSVRIIIVTINIVLAIGLFTSHLLDNMFMYAFWATAMNLTYSNFIYSVIGIVYGSISYWLIEKIIVEDDLEASMKQSHEYLLELCKIIFQEQNLQIDKDKIEQLQISLKAAEKFLIYNRDFLGENTYEKFEVLYSSIDSFKDFCNNIVKIEAIQNKEHHERLKKFYQKCKEIQYDKIKSDWKIAYQELNSNFLS